MSLWRKILNPVCNASYHMKHQVGVWVTNDWLNYFLIPGRTIRGIVDNITQPLHWWMCGHQGAMEYHEISPVLHFSIWISKTEGYTSKYMMQFKRNDVVEISFWCGDEDFVVWCVRWYSSRQVRNNHIFTHHHFVKSVYYVVRQAYCVNNKDV